MLLIDYGHSCTEPQHSSQSSTSSTSPLSGSVVQVDSAHIITHHYTSLHIITHHYTSLHIITHHYTSLHIITHHYTSLHIITHHYTSLQHYTDCVCTISIPQGLALNRPHEQYQQLGQQNRTVGHREQIPFLMQDQSVDSQCQCDN